MWLYLYKIKKLERDENVRLLYTKKDSIIAQDIIRMLCEIEVADCVITSSSMPRLF